MSEKYKAVWKIKKKVLNYRIQVPKRFKIFYSWFVWYHWVIRLQSCWWIWLNLRTFKWLLDDMNEFQLDFYFLKAHVWISRFSNIEHPLEPTKEAACLTVFFSLSCQYLKSQSEFECRPTRRQYFEIWIDFLSANISRKGDF